MSDEDLILRGPPVGPVPDCSLGEYIFRSLKSHSPDFIIQVEADTGAQQTVSELLEMSIRLSEGLHKLGVKENDIVGLMCRNCFEANEIVLGTWLSRAAISPAHGGMTVAEMKHYLELSMPKVLFCDEESIANAMEAMSLVPKSSPIVFVGNKKKCPEAQMVFEEILVEADVKNYKPQPVKSPSSQLVATPMSSGTSGLPKLVAITHRNLIFSDLNLKDIYPFNEGMVLIQISHFFWITGILIFLRCLIKCQKRILLRNTTVDNVLKAIEQYKAEFSFMAPLFAFSLVQSPNFEKFDLSSMKVIAVGGSPLTEKMAKTIKEKWKNIKLIQGYGTTESSGTICFNDEKENLLSVGKVTPGLQVKFIDETGKALKANTPGELLVKTPGLMKCYLWNEKATKESLDSDGWLHTGDLGYYDESGDVYLIDRIKEMVKVMNMQISPTEVEKEILNIPGIKEAGVTGVTNDGHSYQLSALVVKEKNSTVTEKDIHAHIANTLSDYKKITGGIYFVDSLPKTASEKLQKKEIRKIAQTLYSNASK